MSVPTHHQITARRTAIVQSYDWLDRVLHEVLPPKLYKMARDMSGTLELIEQRHLIVREYLKKNKFRIELSTNRVYRNGKLLHDLSGHDK